MRLSSVLIIVLIFLLPITIQADSSDEESIETIWVLDFGIPFNPPTFDPQTGAVYTTLINGTIVSVNAYGDVIAFYPVGYAQEICVPRLVDVDGDGVSEAVYSFMGADRIFILDEGALLELQCPTLTTSIPAVWNGKLVLAYYNQTDETHYLGLAEITENVSTTSANLTIIKAVKIKEPRSPPVVWSDIALVASSTGLWVVDLLNFTVSRIELPCKKITWYPPIVIDFDGDENPEAIIEAGGDIWIIDEETSYTIAEDLRLKYPPYAVALGDYGLAVVVNHRSGIIVLSKTYFGEQLLDKSVICSYPYIFLPEGDVRFISLTARGELIKLSVKSGVLEATDLDAEYKGFIVADFDYDDYAEILLYGENLALVELGFELKGWYGTFLSMQSNNNVIGKPGTSLRDIPSPRNEEEEDTNTKFGIGVILFLIAITVAVVATHGARGERRKRVLQRFASFLEPAKKWAV